RRLEHRRELRPARGPPPDLEPRGDAAEMNDQIRKLTVFGVLLLIALIAATTYWQTWAVAGLEDRQDNAIQVVAQFTIRRGLIYSADGKPLAANRVKRID